MIWANLVHLGYNMWNDRVVPPPSVPRLDAKPYLRFDDSLWRELVRTMIEAGLNMVVLDLGDGVRYESHPELAVQGAWPAARLREELALLRGKGLEPMPKLNFSASHDVWLGPYARQVSTETYYEVCRDLINEVIALFDGPRFFHLGMDEEAAEHQRYCEYVVVRQHDLWWHDLNTLLGAVEQGGARPWVWADYLWRHADTFLERMPKSVLQSNWYYEDVFDAEVKELTACDTLNEHRYDQIPAGEQLTPIPTTSSDWLPTARNA